MTATRGAGAVAAEWRGGGTRSSRRPLLGPGAVPAVVAALRATLDRDVADLARFVALPGVSADPGAVAPLRTSARWVAGRLRRAGFTEIRLVAAARGGPTVLGVYGHDPRRPTLLVYGHHDVQPAGPRGAWHSDPFRLEQRDGVLRGRGVSDDKGQLAAWLDAFSAWHAVAGGWPVNLRVVVDGGEEIGSPELDAVLRRHRGLLRCDVAAVADSTRAADDRPALVRGGRGALAVTLRAHRPGGTPHAGRFGGIVPDAAAALAAVVSGVVGSPRWLTSSAPPPSTARRDDLARARADPALLARRAGAPVIACAPGGVAPDACAATRPSATVVGLRAGSGAAAVPARATAELDVRIVEGQVPATVAAALRRQVARLVAERADGVTVDVHVGSSVRPTTTGGRSAAASAARAAMAAGFGRAPRDTWTGGSLPVAGVLQDVLGVEPVLFGLGDPDDRAHAADERMAVSTYVAARVTTAAFLAELAWPGRAVGYGRGPCRPSRSPS